jgi:hypothetical protein
LTGLHQIKKQRKQQREEIARMEEKPLPAITEQDMYT